jgi:hypothetical protein
MKPNERIILRACEIIGVPEYFLYDDHTPPAQPESRGRIYRHIPFQWDLSEAPTQLSARCIVSGKGEFSLQLRGEPDHVDLRLSITNHQRVAMGPVEWAFCVIAKEARSLDFTDYRQALMHDGERFVDFASLRVDNQQTLVRVSGANDFVPAIHSHLALSPVRAKASLTVIESPQQDACVAVAFEQSYISFCCTQNGCFHADPFFGEIGPGETKRVRGKLYFVAGDRDEVYRRYCEDF